MVPIHGIACEILGFDWVADEGRQPSDPISKWGNMRHLRTTTTLLAGFLLALAPVRLSALPAFARATGASCAVCHSLPSLQLTAEGFAFQARGFRTEWSKTDSENFSLEKTTGITVDGSVAAVKGAVPSTQASTPDLQLYSGGAVSDHFSYLAMYHLNSSPDPTQNVEQAYIQYNNDLGKNVHLAIRGGSFQPLMLRTFGLGAPTTLSAPLVLSQPVSSSTPFALSTNLVGFDASLMTNWVDFTVGAGNPTTGTAATNPTNHKDGFASALLRFDDNASAFGVFRYEGTNLVFNTVGDPTSGLAFRDDFTRTGLLFRYLQDKWRFVGAWFNGDHKSDALGTQIKNRGYWGELNYNFTEIVGTYVRYERLQPVTFDPTQDTKLWLAGLNGMLFQTAGTGGRWVIEGAKSTQNGVDNKQVVLDFLVAF